ncbi:conserved hypothetical protein [Pediculus humanus corporis]|uniref:PH domain-containing protein n=1 Tax=Pediculus humanus subsp. corporis TaxID=121224 RepID=E0VYH7_PEDHC|nr:uncharacterized protein Phum_PHUM514160 [Pediculus humanus corporis]EEB18433.1 conserved hypothetical protein [Pediculus humanus corporis]
MDNNTQRNAVIEPSVAPSSSNSMPNVLFREIHKNAFLKRHLSDRRTGFPRKSERVWVVFCVHDDVEPFLEIYSDQKVALTHKPEWFASLSSALHVSPTICGHEDEFEFAVTLSFQVVRLAAPSWESMMEWVETIRNKLRELKVLCPKENVYSKMPEQKQPLLPTRDPNSPLPLPPEGPSALLPGVELVHVESRNNSTSFENNVNVSRHHQREIHLRGNGVNDRQVNRKKSNERDKRLGMELMTRGSENQSSSSRINNETTFQDGDRETNESNEVFPNVSELQRNKPRVRRAVSVPEPKPSTSQVAMGSNVTVIEVSSNNGKENHCFPDGGNAVICNTVNTSDDEDTDEEEVHYEHVFLASGPSGGKSSQQTKFNSKCVVVGKNKMSKPHSTSVIINSNTTALVNSSPNGTDPTAGSSNKSAVSAGSSEVQVNNVTSTCINLNATELNIPLPPPPHSTKLENMSVSGLIPRVPPKVSTKQGIFKPSVIPSNVILESQSCSIQNGNSESVNCGEQNGGTKLTIVENENNNNNNNNNNVSGPSYSQVKKIQKVKVKCDEMRNPMVKTNSPILEKKIVSEIQIVESDPPSSSNHNQFAEIPSKNQISISNSKVSNKIEISKKCSGGCSGSGSGSSSSSSSSSSGSGSNSTSKNLGLVNVTVSQDVASNSKRNPCCSNGDYKIKISNPSTASTSPGNPLDNCKIFSNKGEPQQNHNNNTETEPLMASVQPAVGMISVEDIPLIGGHQRRRRRSSSSDAPPPINLPPSRVTGGADRIRINVPLTSNHSTVREECRGENEIRSSSSSSSSNHPRNSTEPLMVHVNIEPQSSARLTLREQQVLQLKKEMLHPGGVRLQLRRKDCTGSIALVDALNGVW